MKNDLAPCGMCEEGLPFPHGSHCRTQAERTRNLRTALKRRGISIDTWEMSYCCSQGWHASCPGFDNVKMVACSCDCGHLEHVFDAQGRLT